MAWQINRLAVRSNSLQFQKKRPWKSLQRLNNYENNDSAQIHRIKNLTIMVIILDANINYNAKELFSNKTDSMYGDASEIYDH